MLQVDRAKPARKRAKAKPSCSRPEQTAKDPMPDNERISPTLRREAELATSSNAPAPAVDADASPAPGRTAGPAGSANFASSDLMHDSSLSTHSPCSHGSTDSPCESVAPCPADSADSSISSNSDKPKEAARFAPQATFSEQSVQDPASAAESSTEVNAAPNGSGTRRRFTPDYSAVLPEAAAPDARPHGPNRPGESGGQDEQTGQSSLGRKRLFIGLICGTSLLLCIILVLGWGVPYIGFENIHPSVPYITGTLLVLVILFIGWAALSLVLQVITGKVLFGTKRARGVTVKLFLPLLEFSCRLIGIAPKDVRRSFIQVNNELVDNSAKRYSPDKLLILLPHCIQWSGCNLRVSSRLERCKRCGNCCVGSLLDLTDKYGVSMAIATGGTIARRIVVQKRPRLIIAIACERDLASGIQDTHPLPVYGILNQRPYGPCVDTLVALPEVEKALRRFIRPEDLPV